jgi:hypothetical protein
MSPLPNIYQHSKLVNPNGLPSTIGGRMDCEEWLRRTSTKHIMEEIRKTVHEMGKDSSPDSLLNYLCKDLIDVTKVFDNSREMSTDVAEKHIITLTATLSYFINSEPGQTSALGTEHITTLEQLAISATFCQKLFNPPLQNFWTVELCIAKPATLYLPIASQA